MRTEAASRRAKEAYRTVEALQHYFVERLDGISRTFGADRGCEAVAWERDGGRHGGGVRYETRDETIFNRGSVNISQVHYDDDPSKKLGSATAISTIIHPKNPHAPSVHMHISWTEMKGGEGYWRIMADLNPSLENGAFKQRFDVMLAEAAGVYAEEGMAQGDRYFTIPVLGRTRGVSHFYLEGFNSGDFEADRDFAYGFGKRVIDTYIGIVTEALRDHTDYTAEERQRQLDYHTLYLFQVLTLDRGTTSGLLIHDQNDIGIMGSLPSHVNRVLLESWMEKMPKPQEKLLSALLDALPDGDTVAVDTAVKKRLADAVRNHYRDYPEALSMQASGEIIPPTVANHS